ncbi:YhgE/Pip domain-containing protein [Agromyces atrinae]|nr:YhgE/Pip domain-containing protein [Agromyces atrinae]NYD67467.1 putative membrane protein [Agromyces atrinae]
MRNVWRVFTRDLKRLSTVPLAWVIIGGALITPSLYAWLNIVAFWNPFDNTKNLPIAVVNLDEGAYSSLTGDLNVGDQLVAQLKDNDDLGWQFLSESEAMESLKSGNSYAAFVVPASFSSDLLSITTGDFTQPKLEYYVNEKLNGVAPEITDTGATTVQTQMIDAFTEQVASSAVDAIRQGSETVEDDLARSQARTIGQLDLAAERVAETRSYLLTLQTDIDSTRGGLASAQNTLLDMETAFGDLSVVLAEASALADRAQTQLLDLTAAAMSASVDSASRLSSASAAAQTAIGSVAQGLDLAKSRIQTQIASIDDSTASIAGVRLFLEDPNLPLDPAVRDSLLADLDVVSAQLDGAVAALDLADQGLSDGGAALQGAADRVNAAFQEAANAVQTMNSALTTHVPAMQRSMAELNAVTRSLSATLDTQRAILTESRQLIGGLDDQLEATSAALIVLDGDLGALQGDMGTAITDLRALSGAAAWQQLTELTSLDADQIAQFMSMPVVVKQITLFPTNSYGSLMGSLFINLSLWIGAFVLVVILKLEVDREGIPKLTERQAYMGRWLLFATIAVMQAIVLSIGNLIIGVQHVNAFAFVVTPVLIGLAYLSIIYALSVTFGYIGKGLCVILVIMQIPGASGIYPIELMPPFFQTLYPFFPFTYGIDAMREVISGFAGFAYWRYLGVLLLFTGLAFFLGLVLRNGVSNLTRLFTQQVGATELFTNEEVTPPGRGYRLNHLLAALANRASYQERLSRRVLPFARSYRKVRAAIIVIGVIGIGLLFTLSALVPDIKTALVGWWVLWLLIVFGALIALEYMRYSLRLSTEVGNMPEAELRRELAETEAQR